jgi:hypothetical protein
MLRFARPQLFAALGSLALLGGCAADDVDSSTDISEDPSVIFTPTGLVETLPSLTGLPNIAAAAAARFGANPALRAHFVTGSGFQIYRCDNTASGPAWTLRTPLAQLHANLPTLLSYPQVSNAIHARSDFGGLVSDAELSAMGLIDAAGARSVAPTWQITFGESVARRRIPTRREIVAGRVVAQDAAPTPTSIPSLLIEVRGRAVSTIQGGVAVATSNVADATANPIASSDYLLRLSNGLGTAPDAAACTSATLGQESQTYYTANYYFVDVNGDSAP